MSWRRKLIGFYAILDADDEALARLLVRPVQEGGAGARVMQVRIKPREPVPAQEIARAARMAREVTREYGALLVVNDRLDIALAVGADAVHLGQNDLPLADARAVTDRLGARLLIGISTHNREQVEQAVRGGADYVGFGPVYPTETKDNPDPVQGLAGLRRAVSAAGAVPVVAIGGITPERAAAVAAAGAAAACAVKSVNHVQNRADAGAHITKAWRLSGD